MQTLKCFGKCHNSVKMVQPCATLYVHNQMTIGIPNPFYKNGLGILQIVLQKELQMQKLGWLVGYFGFNGPSRQYFSLYRAVSQREGERKEKGWVRVKMSKQPPPAPTASAAGPCPTVIQIVGRPGTVSLPSTIAPPDPPPPPPDAKVCNVCMN